MNYKQYKNINDEYKNDFYQVPKIFFHKLLKEPKALAIYMLMYNRFTLSKKSYKFMDKNGNIFIHFSRVQASNILGFSRQTVAKSFEFLINEKIIEEVDCEDKTGMKKIFFLSEEFHYENGTEEFKNKIQKEKELDEIFKELEFF
ncbi:replication initiator protein A [[Mycoplasma] gypis]|uniref:replication initiator protein A n=1 Tax=[Mycoplasma] gypis TaxID=92404 RepID=UPI001967613B|nr:replication initiator protein A [[Mycoplasma] gypis]MBN0919676.1 replication initiator protein A [[Mycoplasma] gypis]